MRKGIIAVNIGAILIILAFLAVFHLQPASAGQPHMKVALKSLQQAKTSLEKAAPDKGGHRAKALVLVNQAIEQVKKGMVHKAIKKKQNYTRP